MILVKIGRKVLRCKVVGGSLDGEIVNLQRINFTHSDNDFDFPMEFTRVQFPVKLAYCLTINKSQGQTLPSVGIYLPQPVFSHGQLYVALSRCSNENNIKILIKNCDYLQGRFKEKPNVIFTRNIVFKEVL